MDTDAPQPVRAVLFDFDDTLSDRVEALARLNAHWHRNLDPLNRPASEEEFVAAMFEFSLRSPDLRGLYQMMLEIWPGCFDSVESALQAHAAVMPDMVALDQRTEDMLLDLRRAHVPVGVVTNGPAATQWAKVRRSGVADLVDAVVVSGEFGVSKPDRAIFDHALALIGASPSETLFVGDNPEADIVGATGVGMRTAWMSLGRPWPLESRRPDHIVGAVWEVRPLLEI